MRRSTVRYPVIVTVEWPDEIDLTKEDVASTAQCVVHQTCGIDVGPTGKIVWADCCSEVCEEEVEFLEGEFA